MEKQIEMHNLAELFIKHFKNVDELTQLGFDVIAFTKDYVNHNELGLAFMTICQNLYEYDVVLTSNEYEKLDHMGQKLFPDRSYKWEYLESLIKT